MLLRHELLGSESGLVGNWGPAITCTLADGAVEGDGSVGEC